MSRRTVEQRFENRIVVGDGAMGSELLARVPDITNLDLAVLEHPRVVLRVHLDYLEAGSEIIQTATFTASRPRLGRLRAAGETELINATAAKLAREARAIAGVDSLVAGSIGPVAGVLDLGEADNRAVARAAFAEQASILTGRGVDLLILESFFRTDELALAIEAVRDVSPLPVVALMTFASERPPHPWAEQAAQLARLAEHDVLAVGLSCAPGPLGTLEILEHLPPLERLLAAQPNSGMVVRRFDRELLSSATPQYLAQFARDAVRLGVNLVGSCCGTGPEHIRAIAEAVEGLEPVRKGPRTVGVAPAESRPAPRDDRPRSPLGAKLAEGRFVRAVQLDPPKGTHADAVLDAARKLAAHGGVDAVDINANPLARLRMDAMWLAAEIQREAQLETIPHVTPRDASVMGLQAQLLGAWRAGVRNVLAITGDPSQLGDYAGQQDVNHVDIFELVRTINRMAEGVDSAGNPIGDPPAFTIGVAVNPNVQDVRAEADRLRRKVDAGARFAMAQVFFEWTAWERLLEVFGGALPIPALVAVWPLTSHRLALRLHHEVPGIVVPQDLLDEMEAAGPDAAAVGRARAEALLEQAPAYTQGVYLIAPFKQPARIIELLDPR